MRHSRRTPRLAAFFSLAPALAVLAGCGAQVKAPRAPAAPAIVEHNDTEPAKLPPLEAPKSRILRKDKDCTWVEATGRVSTGEDDTPFQARAAAIEQARKSAMQDFLGVAVKSRLLDFQEEGFRSDEHLTESVLQTTRRGLILHERVASAGYEPVGDCPTCRYAAVVDDCLADVSPAEKDFQVELDLPRQRFVEGDEASLSVTATGDCYLYVYDVDPDGATGLIVPNDQVPEVHLKAGDTFTYPDDALRRSGIRLVAELPAGHSVSAETIRVIASREPLPEKLRQPGADGYFGLVRRLHESPMHWSDDAQAFMIFKK